MLLEVDSLWAGYGQVEVLRSITINVERGEHVGLFGPNGHGKTTLLRCISGLLRPAAGRVTFDEKDISRLPALEIVSQGLIHVPQGSTLFPRMTVTENLLLGAYSRRAWGSRAENLERVYALFPVLKERSRQLARTLSGGERQMAAIGVGLMGMPRLLMVDEATLGLAPKVKDSLRDAMREIASAGVSMLLVDQDVEMLRSLCRRLYLIERGTVAFETRPGADVSEQEVLERYFGKTVS